MFIWNCEEAHQKIQAFLVILQLKSTLDSITCKQTKNGPFPKLNLYKFDLSEFDLFEFDLSKFDLFLFELSKFNLFKFYFSEFDLSEFDPADLRWKSGKDGKESL